MKLAVTWQMCGFVDVETDTIEEAIDKFDEESDHIPLPSDGEYVDGSFELTTYDPDEMEAMCDLE